MVLTAADQKPQKKIFVMVGIDAVVSIIWNFQIFARLAWNAYWRTQNCFWGISPQNGMQYQRNPQRRTLICASSRRLSHQAWKSVDGFDL